MTSLIVNDIEIAVQLLPDHILGEDRFDAGIKGGLLQLGHYWNSTKGVAVCQVGKGRMA